MRQPHTPVSLLAAGLSLVGGALAGCSGEYGLADETYPVEPVAILEGELRAEIGSALGPTAMALAWAPDLAATERLASLLREAGSACGAEQGAVLEPLSFQPHFPSSFVLPLDTTPAPAVQHALAPLGGQGRVALGHVVSFVDRNRNGVLDAGTERVLATSLDSGLAVLFVDGAPPREGSGTWSAWPRELPQGFSFLGTRPAAGGARVLTVLPAETTSLSLEASRHVCP
ncbi:hypothetical protein [Pyxidicoccus xibeiensis]|uniref:hypothetical protein n=1 Tax=Pyxidicoccus xibeiensis TaxID=2906759 RepID=UPI0020A75764|nr:hypothetical protein [Pyxidicoccus xibeiensis]MCP3142411.1 hypothetical protein [Pyxidicoccus xibeiensis]